ncbi:hypothetical protein MUK42_08602 [Musa troglodytarum]|uniref:Uncharacterized protein n=1 Tax=Musa troglodytarum TaxID=320322 RepID=A0A9E7EHW9_9LILI|nr:hypothetical protein MUK42_08602 [Musa troglodytarum]
MSSSHAAILLDRCIPMSDSISESVALVRSQLEKRRLDGRTIQILESVLVARDVQSLLETRSALRQLFRSEALSVMGGISGMTVDRKLITVQFFVWAFALVGDVESCLALKYEALVLRESKHLKIHGLEVSYEEWLTFAKDSLDNGFYPIAVQGFERALHCFQTEKVEDPEFLMSSEDAHIIKYIKKLKDVATSLIASCSVQTQSAEYLKRKGTQENICISCLRKTNHVASSMFRCGIKKRNMQKLQSSQGLPKEIGLTDKKI